MNALLSKENLVEALKNAAETKEPWVGRIPPKKHVRQGDVYLVNTGKSNKDQLIVDGDEDENKSIQLAPGDTKGSRHFLEIKPGIRVFSPKEADDLTGVTIEVDESCEARVTHPTHREFRIKGPCNLQVMFPQDLTDPNTIRRLAD